MTHYRRRKEVARLRKLIIPAQSWDTNEDETEDTGRNDTLQPSVTFNYARL